MGQNKNSPCPINSKKSIKMSIKTIMAAPKPSAKKSHKSKKSKNRSNKKPASHKMKMFKGRRNRNGRTIAQVVLMGIHAFGKQKGATFRHIRSFCKASGIKVSNFVLKKVLKKMCSRKVLACPKGFYVATGNSLPTSSVNRRKRATMRRAARKIARGGRTFEQVVFDLLTPAEDETKRPKMTFNQIKAGMRHAGITTNNWILLKVMERLRQKKLIRCKKWHNSITGRKFYKGQSKK